MRGTHQRAPNGFTLTELLLVLAIIVLLAVLLLPALGRIRCDTGHRTNCMNNLRQIGLALHNYSHTPVPILQCSTWGSAFPSEKPWKTTYVGIAGVGSEAAKLPLSHANIGVFGYDRQITFADVKDGTSNTLMILESGWKTGSWAQGGFSTVRGFEPKDKAYMGNGCPFSGTHLIESSLFTRGHSVGCNAMMVDGSVRFLNDSISPDVLEALATIAGGEKVPKDY
jgi:prepilin-type N-terminal cleavage/methylation domain-containing protein/prepilin-type processing-associated H-X9-DG protein